MSSARAPARPESLAGDLARAVGRLRRSLNRRARSGAGASALPEAQVEILSAIRRHAGIRVHDLAIELGLASNTVSTLAGRLVEVGLVKRDSDLEDGRVARLRLLPDGEVWLRRWRDQRKEALAEQLAALDPADRAAVALAVPVLERLAAAVAGVAGPADVPVGEASDGV